MNSVDTCWGKILLKPFGSIYGSDGILSSIKYTFLQFGWPITRMILTNWSREFVPLKMGFPKHSLAITHPRDQTSIGLS